MKRDYTKYYRQFIPYRYRYVLRQLAYRVLWRVRGDKFVEIKSEVFVSKATEVYSENVNLFYVAPQTILNGEVIPKQVKPVAATFVNKVWRLENVTCYGASDVIRLDKHHYLYEVRDFYRKIGKTGVVCSEGVGLTEDEPKYFIVPRYKQIEHVERGILLSSYFASNYYHFTFQCLAKLRLCGKIDKKVPLLVHESVAKYPSFQQLLQICNVDKREMISLSTHKQYEVDELYYTSPQTISVPHYRRNAIKMLDDDLYCEESLTYLRETMLPHMDTEWSVPERVFLQRRFASARRGYNEEECEQLLVKYGFVCVRPETLTLGQQIALFNKAKCIVSATGAAFTNLIYSGAGGKFVILKGAISDESIFSSLAAFNNAQLIYLCDKTKGLLTDASQEHDKYKININELKMLIEQII